MISFKVFLAVCLAISYCDALPARRRLDNRLHRTHNEPHVNNNYHEERVPVRKLNSPVGRVEYAQGPGHQKYEGPQYQPVPLHRANNRHGDLNLHLQPLPYRGEPQLRHVNRRLIRPAYASNDPIYTPAQEPFVGAAEVVANDQPIKNDYKDEDYSPKPYDFGYDSTDEYGNNLFRKETSDSNGFVTGSYGYRDAYGIYRTVEYTADDYGFRARLKSNEPGLGNKAAADTEVFVEPPPPEKAVEEKASARRIEYIPIDGFPPHGQDLHRGFNHQQASDFIPY